MGFEFVDDQAISIDGKSVQGNGTSGHVTAQMFEFVALVCCALDGRVEGEINKINNLLN